MNGKKLSVFAIVLALMMIVSTSAFGQAAYTVSTARTDANANAGTTAMADGDTITIAAGGKLTVGSTLNHTNTVIRMDSGAKLIVAATKTLTIDSLMFYSGYASNLVTGTASSEIAGCSIAVGGHLNITNNMFLNQDTLFFKGGGKISVGGHVMLNGGEIVSYTGTDTLDGEIKLFAASTLTDSSKSSFTLGPINTNNNNLTLNTITRGTFDLLGDFTIYQGKTVTTATVSTNFDSTVIASDADQGNIVLKGVSTETTWTFAGEKLHLNADIYADTTGTFDVNNNKAILDSNIVTNGAGNAAGKSVLTLALDGVTTLELGGVAGIEGTGTADTLINPHILYLTTATQLGGTSGTVFIKSNDANGDSVILSTTTDVVGGFGIADGTELIMNGQTLDIESGGTLTISSVAAATALTDSADGAAATVNIKTGGKVSIQRTAVTPDSNITYSLNGGTLEASNAAVSMMGTGNIIAFTNSSIINLNATTANTSLACSTISIPTTKKLTLTSAGTYTADLHVQGDSALTIRGELEVDGGGSGTLTIDSLMFHDLGTTGDSGPLLDVDADVTVDSMTQKVGSAAMTIDILTNKTLTVTDTLRIIAGDTVIFSGFSNTTFDGQVKFTGAGVLNNNTQGTLTINDYIGFANNAEIYTGATSGYIMRHTGTTGMAIGTGVNMKFAGTGKVEMDEYMTVADVSGILNITGQVSKIAKVKSLGDDAEIDVDDDATITDLRLTAADKGITIDVAANKTLTVTNGINPDGSGTVLLEGTAPATIVTDWTLDSASTIDIDGGIYLNGTISIDSVGVIDKAATCSLSTAITVAADDTLRILGAGTLAQTKNEAINLGSGSNLYIGGAGTIEAVTTTSSNAVIRVEGANATIDTLDTSVGFKLYFGSTNSLTIPAVTLTSGGINMLSGANGGQLAGGVITLTDATLTMDNANAGISNDIVLNSGSTLDLNQDMTLGQEISLGGDATIDVYRGKTLTYTYATNDLSVGANTLTFAGAGTFDNNTSAYVLIDDASGAIAFSGGATVAYVKVDVAEVTFDINGGSGTITNLSQTSTNELVNVTFTTDDTLSLGATNLSVDTNKTMTVSGIAGGRLEGGTLSLATASAGLSVSQTSGTGYLEFGMAINNTGASTPEGLANATTITTSGDVKFTNATVGFTEDAILNIGAGEMAVTGTDLTVNGDTLMVKGTGRLAMAGNYVDLSNTGSVLYLYSGTPTVSHVKWGSTNGKLVVNTSATIDSLMDLNDRTCNVIFSSTGQTLTISDSVAIGALDTLVFQGGGVAATIAGSTPFRMTSTSGVLKNTTAALTYTKGVQFDAAGKFKVDTASSMSGNFTMQGDGDIAISSGILFTYSGAEVMVGGNTLTISDAGSLAVSGTGNFSLDSSGSALTISSTGYIGGVSVDEDEATINATANGYIGTLTANEGFNLDITSGDTLTVVSDVTIGDNDTLDITDTGVLAGAGDLSITGTGATLTPTANTDIDKPVVVNGTTIQNASKTLDFAYLTLAGNFNVLNGKAVTIDTLATSADATFSEDSSANITMSKIKLNGDLDLVSGGNEDNNNYVFTSLASMFATSSTVSTLTIDTSVTLAAVTTLGQEDGNLGVDVTQSAQLVSFTNAGLTLDGTVTIATEDTVRFTKSFTVAAEGMLYANSADTYIDISLPDENMVMNGDIKASAGIVNIDVASSFVSTNTIGSTGTRADSIAVIDMAGTGTPEFRVDGTGTIILPPGYGATMNATKAGMVIEDTGLLRAGDATRVSDTDSLFTFDNASGHADYVQLIAGEIKNIKFVTVVTGTSTNTDNINYTTAVFVSMWYDTTGTGETPDGTPDKPYFTITEGLAAANESETGGKIVIAAGTYTVSSTITLDKVSINGSDNMLFGSGVGQSWTGSTAGVTDKRPVLNFTNTGYAFHVINQFETDAIEIKGFEIITNANNTSVVHVSAPGNLENFEFSYNTVTMMNGQSMITLADTTGLVDPDVNYNKTSVSGDGYHYFVNIMGPDSSITNFDIEGNEITDGASYFDLGAGNIAFAFQSNTHIGGAGVLLTTTGTPTGKFTGVTMTTSTFKGVMDYAMAISGLASTSFADTAIYTTVSVTDNHFFFMPGASFATVDNGVTDETVTYKNFITATDNWWGAYTGPVMEGSGSYAAADVSTNVDYSPIKLVPELTATQLVVTGVESAIAYTPIEVTVYSGINTRVEFVTNFEADLPTGPQEVKANTPDAYDNQTFTIVPKEAMSGAKITVKTVDNDAGDFLTAMTNEFDITAVTIGAPGNFDATDWTEAGDYVKLSFTPSANHPGMGADVEIDYYLVMASATNSLDVAPVMWAYFPAANIADVDTIQLRVEAFATTAYYWVAAVAGKLPAGVVPKVADENILTAITIDAELEKAAAYDDQLRASSDAVGPDKAISLSNENEFDWDGDGQVGLGDLSFWATSYGNLAEYEPVFDLDNDGSVGLFDLALFADKYGTAYTLAKAIERVDGKNAETLLDAIKVMDFQNDIVELTIKANQMKSLSGYSFDLKFNTEEYEFVDVRNDKPFDGEGVNPVFLKSVEDGQITVAGVTNEFTDENSLSGEAPLVTFVFKWVGDDASEMFIDNIQVIDTDYNMNKLERTSVDPVPLPEEFELMNNYPNPFNPVTKMRFALPKSENVTIVIYNVLGQKVKTLVSNQKFRAGIRTFKWNGTNDQGMRVGSGTYIYRIKMGNYVSSKKMTLIK